MEKASQKPEKPGFRERLVATWFAFDPRSLALFRIGFALLLLVDLLRRVPGLVVWYSNEGLIPNHTQLWRPPSEWTFSLFFLASSPFEAALGFVLCGIAFLGLLVGWRTKLFQILSLVAVVSLHSRAVILENGGDVVMNLLAAWSAFMPLGQRFSVDSLLRSLRERRESNPAHLEERPAKANAPFYSLAVFGILVQLSVIYFFNTIHKNGPAWRDGSVVHWVLHQDRIVTWLGFTVRDDFPLPLSQALTYATLLAEGAAPILLLTPFATVWARRIAMVALPSMHIGFAIFLNVGLFSPTMCTFFLLLPSARDWDAITRFFQKRTRPRTVFYDGSCGVCFQVARVLLRMDVLERLTFVDNSRTELLPEGITPEIVERTVVVVDDRGRITMKSAAFVAIFRSIPLGTLFAWPLAIPGLRTIADRAYDRFAENRHKVSVCLGYAACGLPMRDAPVETEPPPTPFRNRLVRARGYAREALVLVMMAATTSQMLVENRAIRSRIKFGQPKVLKAIVHYGRFFQGWSMFAPDAPRNDGIVVVDATTVDGRRIDPLNYAATGHTGEPWETIPPRLGQDQFWCDYVNRIRGHRSLHHVFEKWLLAHHERTGNPNDRIVAFDVYWLSDRSPPPGKTEPERVKRERFMRYRSDQPKKSPDVARN